MQSMILSVFEACLQIRIISSLCGKVDRTALFWATTQHVVIAQRSAVLKSRDL